MRKQRGNGVADQGVSSILRKMNCCEVVWNGLKTHGLSRCDQSWLAIVEVGSNIWTPEISVDRVRGACRVETTICSRSPAGLLEVKYSLGCKLVGHVEIVTTGRDERNKSFVHFRHPWMFMEGEGVTTHHPHDLSESRRFAAIVCSQPLL